METQLLCQGLWAPLMSKDYSDKPIKQNSVQWL